MATSLDNNRDKPFNHWAVLYPAWFLIRCNDAWLLHRRVLTPAQLYAALYIYKGGQLCSP